jgi:hypothetical protein
VFIRTHIDAGVRGCQNPRFQWPNGHSLLWRRPAGVTKNESDLPALMREVERIRAARRLVESRRGMGPLGGARAVFLNGQDVD